MSLQAFTDFILARNYALKPTFIIESRKFERAKLAVFLLRKSSTGFAAEVELSRRSASEACVAQDFQGIDLCVLS